MVLKFTKLITFVMIVTIAFGVSSCKKNNVSKLEVDNSFAFQLMNDDSITIVDLLDIIDSTWTETIHVTPDGSLSILTHSDTVRNVISGKDLLNDIEDVNVNVDETVMIPELTVPDSLLIIRDFIASFPQGSVPPFEFAFSFDTTVNLHDIAKVAFTVDGFIIDEVVMKSGDMDFIIDVDADDELNLQAQLSSENIFKGTDIMEVNADNHDHVMFDLADWTMKPVDDSLTISAWARISISENINQNTPLSRVLEIISKIENASGEKSLRLNGGIYDISFKSVQGLVNVQTKRFSGYVDSVTVDIKGMEGDLGITTPKFNIKYVNTFGFPVNTYLDSLYYINKYDEFVDIIRPGANPIETIIEPTGEDEFKSIDISENLIPTMDLLDGVKRFGYGGDAFVMGGQSASVTEDSHIDITSDVEIPFSVKINELRMLDTLAFSIGGGSSEITNYLDGVEFKFKVINGLPLKTTVQLYMCDSTYLDDSEYYVVDSLFKPDAQGIMYNTIAASFSGETVTSVIYVPVNGKSLENLLYANTLIIKLAVSTEGNEVNLKASDVLGLAIGLKTRTTDVVIKKK